MTSDAEAELLPDYFKRHFGIQVSEDVWKKWPDTKSSVARYPGEDFSWKGRAPFMGETNVPPTDASWQSLRLSKILMKAVKKDVPTGRKQLFSMMSSYMDLLYLRGNLDTMREYRWSYCLHILNHMMKVREEILENNSKLENKPKGEECEIRDQGVTRPRVLIILPFRESAKQVVEIMSDLLVSFGKNRISNHQKFESEFSGDEDQVDNPRKPNDYNLTFSGNTDDSFRLGAALTKKTLKLYADFYESDIIICSSLALRMKITGDKDYDFLSSFEIVIFDQLEVLMMQNWEHVVEIMSHLNLQPKKSHGVDFNRVKMSVLEGRSKFYRQTLMFGSVNFNEAFALFNHCHNIEGQIIAQKLVSESDSSIRTVFSACRQTFQRFDCSSIESCSDERFKFFTEIVLPKIRSESHVMIYVSCYFDFVRLRNYFRKEEVDFVGLCEYSKEGKIAEARAQLFHESRRIMLYTERFHFYRRFQIKGVRHVLFYQLPTIPIFYPQICNLAMTEFQGAKFTGDESSFSVSTIFCKFDGHRLAGVLGTEKAIQVSKKKVHCFVADSVSFQ